MTRALAGCMMVTAALGAALGCSDLNKPRPPVAVGIRTLITADGQPLPYLFMVDPVMSREVLAGASYMYDDSTYKFYWLTNRVELDSTYNNRVDSLYGTYSMDDRYLTFTGHDGATFYGSLRADTLYCGAFGITGMYLR